jgi:predicted kinase
VVRGTITRYEPDLPLAFTGSDNPDQRTVTVSRRLVQLTVNVEIIDQHTEKALWQRQGLTSEGDYDPGNEAAGRTRALDRLTVNIVEGAQSQW